jgi:hypothetical protein
LAGLRQLEWYPLKFLENLIEKSELKTPIVSYRARWEANNKMVFSQLIYDSVD